MTSSPRLFISYRSSDGTDKAAALARDLGERFGPAQVFLDKDDLRAGAPWREEIARTLGERPIVLLLVTPALLGGARDAQGRRRIDAPDDPVRMEIEAALAAGAHLIPLLCDGLTTPPDEADLPPSLRVLAERTWRRLRAYDWAQDLARLAGDLQALGVVPLHAAAAPPRRTWLLGGGAALAVLLAGAGVWAWRRPGANDFGGPWLAQVGRRGATTAEGGATWRLQLVHSGAKLRLTTEPIDVGNDPDWADYRHFWQERHGQPLPPVLWRGEGEVLTDPGQAPVIDLAMRNEVAGSGEQVDGGNLHAVRQPDGSVQGRLWVNGDQAERLVVMRRR